MKNLPGHVTRSCKTRLHPTLGIVLLATAFSLSSCALAPGMRYARSAPAEGIDTSAQIGGVRVELRSLTPAVISEMAKAHDLPLLPEELVSTKFEPYRLGRGDVLTIPVWGHPELSLPLGEFRSDIAAGQTIDDSGSFYYPFVGPIAASGLTSVELRSRVLSLLSRYITNPQLDVKITGFRSQKVLVHGAVDKPNSVALTDVPLTLLDAINACGGVRTQDQLPGDPSHVELTRDGHTHVLDLFGRYPGGTQASQLILKNGDIVRVPTSTESKVYVLGEVDRPTAVPFNTRTKSLTQAIAEVGGFQPLSAQAKGVYVLRNELGRIRVWHLDARSPVALAIADKFLLVPGDLVFVDATRLATWNRVIGLLLPTSLLFSQTTQGIQQYQAVTK